MKGKADGTGGGGEEQGSRRGDRVSKAKASNSVGELGDVGCRQWQGKRGVGDVGDEHGNGGVNGGGEWGVVVKDRGVEVGPVEEGGVGGADGVVW